MRIRLGWDMRKAHANLLKHRVSFEEAGTALEDLFSLTIPDRMHSDEEDRYVTIGVSARGRLLVVVHTDRRDLVRIISARLATAHERTKYEEGR